MGDESKAIDETKFRTFPSVSILLIINSSENSTENKAAGHRPEARDKKTNKSFPLMDWLIDD